MIYEAFYEKASNDWGKIDAIRMMYEKASNDYEVRLPRYGWLMKQLQMIMRQDSLNMDDS